MMCLQLIFVQCSVRVVPEDQSPTKIAELPAGSNRKHNPLKSHTHDHVDSFKFLMMIALLYLKGSLPNTRVWGHSPQSPPSSALAR